MPQEPPERTASCASGSTPPTPGPATCWVTRSTGPKPTYCSASTRNWDYDRQKLISPELTDQVDANIERQSRHGQRIIEFYTAGKTEVPVYPSLGGPAGPGLPVLLQTNRANGLKRRLMRGTDVELFQHPDPSHHAEHPGIASPARGPVAELLVDLAPGGASPIRETGRSQVAKGRPKSGAVAAGDRPIPPGRGGRGCRVCLSLERAVGEDEGRPRATEIISGRYHWRLSGLLLGRIWRP